MQARHTVAETFRAAPSGRRILAADGCASSLSNPAACCFCAVSAPGGPRGVAVAMFGHTGLGMLICVLMTGRAVFHGSCLSAALAMAHAITVWAGIQADVGTDRKVAVSAWQGVRRSLRPGQRPSRVSDGKKGVSMNISSTAWAALISALITGVGIVVASIRWRRDFDQRLQQIHEEVTKQLIDLRIEPYINFMQQLEPLSRRWAHELVADRQKVKEFAEIFHHAGFDAIGMLASSDTRELILATRAACLQYAEMKIPFDRLINRVWAIHRALRSDLGIDQPNWPNEIERRRLRRLAGDVDAIDAIVENAVYITYGLYPDWYLLRRLDSSRSFTAIIFDMDGLLLDTEILEQAAWQRAARDFGCSISDDEFLLLVGRAEEDVKEILVRLWETRAEDTTKFDEIRAKKIDYADQEKINVKEGAQRLLAWARAQHVSTAVASSTARERVFARLRSAGILEDVDVVVGGDEFARGKPAPDVFQLAANRLGSKTEACLVLEDSDSGITAASNAGMIPILVPDASFKRTVPLDIHSLAYRTFGSLSEVLQFLKAARPISQPYLSEGTRFSSLLRNHGSSKMRRFDEQGRRIWSRPQRPGYLGS